MLRVLKNFNFTFAMVLKTDEKKGKRFSKKLLDFVVFGLINLKYKAAKQDFFLDYFPANFFNIPLKIAP